MYYILFQLDGLAWDLLKDLHLCKRGIKYNEN